MATASKKSSSTSRRRAPSPAAKDAIALLVADHKEVKTLFKQYDKLAKDYGPADERQAIAEQICRALIIHTTVEEELFYPAARDALKSDDEKLVDEADIEHAGAKELIAQIQGRDPDADDHYDARVKVLSEYIDHHVKEEEEEMFPKLKKTDLDLKALGADMLARKEELEAEIGTAAQA